MTVLYVVVLAGGKGTRLRPYTTVLFLASVIAIFWLAVNAPYWREVAGFPVGVGLVAIGFVLFV